MSKLLPGNLNIEANMFLFGKKTERDADWFKRFQGSDDYTAFKQKPIAYFCAEYALTPKLPTYAGGLGILAGDIVYEAAIQHLPMYFVGLRYQKGQSNITMETLSIESHDSSKLFLVRGPDNFPILLSLQLHGRTVWYQAWQWKDGNAMVYLIDTDLEQNDPQDRIITHELYVEDRTLRLKQEILLGIGGHRLLRALGLHPSVYHLNEGHSAFLALELIHHEMEHQKVDFKTACIYARQHLLFTNHTIVSAGQEIFTKELVASVLEQYAQEIGISTNDIVSLGTIENSGESDKLFSMTMFSFHMSSKANAVSILHQEKAKGLWPSYPMEAITNGVHIPRWDQIKGDIVEEHQKNKRKLLAYIQEETGEVWDESTLLLGWGRRLVPYKQPLAFIQDTERLMRLANDLDRPFRIVISGPTKEETGLGLAHEVQQLIQEKLKGIAVFLPHYSLPLGRLMTAGCDIWLNTPQIGSEACGTSGMKALVNGVLPLSTRDGWIAEANLKRCGWVIGDTQNLTDALLTVTEKEILPLYYSHIAKPNNSTWKQYMKTGRELINAQFSMTHALRMYVERCYIPLLHHKHTHKYE
jgi:glycogen phosphorylase